MTELLEKAFQEASELPEPEQNVLARWLMDEIISEKNGKKHWLNQKTYWINLQMRPLQNMQKARQKCWMSVNYDISHYGTIS